MGRLIDADALLKWLEECTDENDWLVSQYNADWIYSMLESAPTVDAVEVVRCKDCQHRGDDRRCPMCFEEMIEWDDDGYPETEWVCHDHTTNDGFCERGERREGE